MLQEIKNSKEKLPVAVIFGGEGAEHEISCLSALNVVCALEELGRKYISVYIDRRGCWFIIPSGKDAVLHIDENAGMPTYPLKLSESCSGFLTETGVIPIDTAIPVLHGDMGEDGVVQGALRCAGIKYVGSDTLAGAVAMDKAYTKLLAEYLGIPTVPWFLYIVGVGNDECSKVALNEDGVLKLASEIGYPLFVKPVASGSSIGAGVANDSGELLSAVRYSASVCGRVLIEKKIECPTELECGYFDGGKIVITPPGSIVSSDGFYSFGAKYCGKGETKVSAIADVSDEVKEKLTEYSRSICLLAGIKDIARVDFFLSQGKIYFNEINTFPGMTEDSLYPKMLKEAGIPLSMALDKLLSEI